MNKLLECAQISWPNQFFVCWDCNFLSVCYSKLISSLDPRRERSYKITLYLCMYVWMSEYRILRPNENRPWAQLGWAPGPNELSIGYSIKDRLGCDIWIPKSYRDSSKFWHLEKFLRFAPPTAHIVYSRLDWIMHWNTHFIALLSLN